MKSLRYLATLLALCVFTLAAHAADASPAGRWQWPDMGPDDSSAGTCELTVKDGVVTGTLTSMGSTGPITPGTFRNGVVSFDVTLEGHGGMQFLFSYQAKVEGDTLKGTVERPTPPAGERKKMEWVATRKK